GVEKVEGDQTHVRLALPPVELQCGMDQRPDEDIRDRKGDENQIGPASGEEDAQWARGSRSVNVDPSPRREAADRLPPMPRARSRLMASPSPTPPSPRVSRASTWTNGSKMRSNLSCGTPMPVSWTWISIASSKTAHSTRMRPPRSVNLSALPTRLSKIWRKRSGSA